MLKLLIYTHEFPPFKGGAGMYSHDLAEALASLGVDTHVAAPATSAVQLSTCFHLHHIPIDRGNGSETRRFIAKLQLRHRFDAILITERRAQEIFASFPALLFNYVTVIHGTEILDYFGPSRKTLQVPRQRMEKLFARSFLCIAGSHATAGLVRKYADFLSCEPQVVHYGISLNRLPPVDQDATRTLREKYGLQAEIIFSLGRLDLDKGQDVLLRAFRIVHRTRPQARLLIAGTGPHQEQLKLLCTNLSLDGFVDFIGPVPQETLPALFSACDVFAMPSRCQNRWEGFGLVFLEAAYYGRPSIGGNEGGVPEAIVDGLTGLVVNPNSEMAVAEAIDGLLADKQRRDEMGRCARERVLKNYDSRRMAIETLDLIKATRPKPYPGSHILLALAYPYLVVRTWWDGTRELLTFHALRLTRGNG